MKKLLALLLALAMLTCLAACGESEKPKDDATTTTTTTDTATTTTTKPQEDEFVFEEVTVLDDENCVIRITGIEEDKLWGYTLKGYFENKSDADYMISVDAATINGVAAEPLFAVDVAAGKKAKEDISFGDVFPEGVDIGEYTDIALTFSVSDAEDWEADAVAEETAHVYPLGKDKATVYTREAQETDQVLVDNDLFTMIAIGTGEDELWGYTTDVYFVNKSDKNLLLSVDEASVNDFMAEPFFATALPAESCAFGEIAWFGESLEDSGIDAVESIEFTLSAMDNDDWLGDPLAEEPVTFTP